MNLLAPGRTALGRTIEELSRGGPFRRATTALTLLLVFSIPWQNTVAGASGLNKLLGFVAVLVGIVAILVEGRRWRIGDALFWAFLFAGWAALSLFWTISSSLTEDQALAAVQLAGLMALAWEFCPGRRGARELERAFVWGCWLITAQALVALLTGSAVVVDARIRLGTLHPNDLAFILSLAIPMAWDLASRRKGWAMWSYVGFIPAALFVIVLSGSRSGVMTGLLGALIVPWTLLVGNPRRAATFLVVVAVAIPVVVPLLPSEQRERLATTTEELGGGGTLNNRTVLWSGAFGIWSDHVVAGVGAGASRVEMSERAGYELGAHNTPLSIGAELGVVGLAAFLLVIVAVAVPALRLSGRDRQFAVVLLLVIVVGLQVRHWEYEKALWLCFAVINNLGGSRRALAVRR